jgi:hypothetical protein
VAGCIRGALDPGGQLSGVSDASPGCEGKGGRLAISIRLAQSRKIGVARGYELEPNRNGENRVRSKSVPKPVTNCVIRCAVTGASMIPSR